ncbi:MAG TPA: ferredoxin reductase [Dermatophilaceae bacterium]|nr:ferredoxin reductase [Dermatophilaceae bacterium]
MALIRPLARAASIFTTPLAPEDFLHLINPLASRRQLRGVVTEVIPETADSATIRFRPGKGWAAHQAGQWARIGVEINGVRQWRSYSLTTAAGQDPAITVSAMGTVSTALVRSAKPGDVLFLAPPQGDFVLPEHPRPLLMITAGSGLTPVMSMIRTLVGRRDDADVVLLHSARTPQDSLFTEELARLAAEHPGLRVVAWFTGEQGRRLDLACPADLDRLCPDWRARAAYACGPARMLDAASALWAEHHDPDQLTIERFAPVVVAGAPGEGGLVTFEKSDKEFHADGQTTLLEAGEDAGVVVSSGCRMGICHTCVTPLLSGRVRDLRTGEVHGEVGQVVQTCVSTAAGPVHLDI